MRARERAGFSIENRGARRSVARCSGKGSRVVAIGVDCRLMRAMAFIIAGVISCGAMSFRRRLVSACGARTSLEGADEVDACFLFADDDPIAAQCRDKQGCRRRGRRRPLFARAPLAPRIGLGPVQPSQAKPGLPLSHPSTSPVPPTHFSTTGAGRPHAWRCVQLCEWLAGSPGSTNRGPAALSLSFSASQPVPGTLWRVLLRHVRADARTTLPHVMLTLSIVARLYLGSCMPPSRRIAALQSVVAGLETGPGARKLPVSIKSLELRVPKRFNNKRDWCV